MSDISQDFQPADILGLLDSITDLTAAIFSGSFFANSARRSHQTAYGAWHDLDSENAFDWNLAN